MRNQNLFSLNQMKHLDCSKLYSRYSYDSTRRCLGVDFGIFKFFQYCSAYYWIAAMLLGTVVENSVLVVSDPKLEPHFAKRNYILFLAHFRNTAYVIRLLSLDKCFHRWVIVVPIAKCSPLIHEHFVCSEKAPDRPLIVFIIYIMSLLMSSGNIVSFTIIISVYCFRTSSAPRGHSLLKHPRINKIMTFTVD